MRIVAAHDSLVRRSSSRRLPASRPSRKIRRSRPCSPRPPGPRSTSSTSSPASSPKSTTRRTRTFCWRPSPIPGLGGRGGPRDVGPAGIRETPRAESRLPDRQVARQRVAAVPRRLRSRSHSDTRPRTTARQAVPRRQDRCRVPAARQGHRRRERPLQPRRRSTHDQQPRVRPDVPAARRARTLQVHDGQAGSQDGRHGSRRRVRRGHAPDADCRFERAGHAGLRPLLD